MNALIFGIYSAAMWCAQPLLRRKLRLRGRAEPVYLMHTEERFGHYPNHPQSENDQKPNASKTDAPQYIWIHAVSLGETRVAAVLVAALRESLPNMKLLLTHGTATGRAEGLKWLQAGDVQVWQPWDTKAAVGRFLQHFKPRIGIMIETELWPNMAMLCAQRGILMVLANARMSEKTFKQTQRLAWLARPVYQSLAAVWPQTAVEAARFKALGAAIHSDMNNDAHGAGEVFGNIKFDAKIDAAQLKEGRRCRDAGARPVVMFASSREGEELQLLAYLREQPRSTTTPQVQYLIVPRHPQRFDAVAALIEAHGFKVSRRSAWLSPSSNPVIFADDADDEVTIWLGDSLGEMAFYYGLSDVALLGGTFEPLGGQNLIEAAACACPVVMGPSTFNFLEVAHLAVQTGAAWQTNTLPQAVEAALALIEDAPALIAARQSAMKFAAIQQGAASKTAQAVLKLLR